MGFQWVFTGRRNCNGVSMGFHWEEELQWVFNGRSLPKKKKYRYSSPILLQLFELEYRYSGGSNTGNTPNRGDISPGQKNWEGCLRLRV